MRTRTQQIATAGIALTAAIVLTATSVDAQGRRGAGRDGRRPPGSDAGAQAADTRDDDVSPVRRIRRGPRPDGNRETPPSDSFRTIDGSDNNRDRPDMGAADTPLARLADPDYADGISTLAGADRPSPRAISNAVLSTVGAPVSPTAFSDYLWQWGQFLDHDLDLTDGTDPPEPAPISVPSGDPFFDPAGTGDVEMELNRSVWDPVSGTSRRNPRQQLNEITAWIDASNVYGSDAERARALRTLDGTGRLATSAGNLLPFNEAGLPNAGGDADTLFLAGDVRANEQLGLTAMHTLFVREHNRLAERIREQSPDMSGEAIYQRARQLVGAMMQIITYREFLPALLGPDWIGPYTGYRRQVDARISNLFSTAAYRFGHSALSERIMRIDAAGDEIAAGHLALRDAFFRPDRLGSEGGIDPILRGLAAQPCQDVDPFVIDDVRNFLFGPPGAGGFDLGSLNIQRGRDHGLPSYNDARRALGLGPARSFAEVSSVPEIRERLQTAYDDVEQVDVWVGGLAEDDLPGAMVGELFFTILADQFEALRDGDRFWYERVLSPTERVLLEATRLSDVIRRNTGIGAELPGDVFRIP